MNEYGCVFGVELGVERWRRVAHEAEPHVDAAAIAKAKEDFVKDRIMKEAETGALELLDVKAPRGVYPDADAARVGEIVKGCAFVTDAVHRA